MAVPSHETIPSTATTVSSAQAAEVSLLGSYKFERFLPHTTWLALLRVLASKGGGTYALSGPRGAGKTWTMERAGTWAEEQGGLMIPFPSPSEYEPTAFIASLSEVVANRYERYYDQKTQATTRTAFLRFRRRSVAGIALAYIFAALAAYGFVRNSSGFDDRVIRQYINPYFLLGIGGILGSIIFLQYTRHEYRADREGLRLVKRKAEDLREKVRYATTLKESAEVGLEGKATGAVARLKRASERQLVERPATLSSLIQAFREFVELMASAIDGPVIIAVDELDKMSDRVKVAQLLRDIKGIFDIRGTSFVVSLSNEAARSLDLGGVRTRNEFNSSFYAVFTVPSLPPDQCIELLRYRVPTFPTELGTVASVLGAGIPREVVRIAEVISADGVIGRSARQAVGAALRIEVQAFLDEALAVPTQRTTAVTNIGGAEKVALYNAIGQINLDTPTAQALTLALDNWALNDTSPTWCAHFQEEWRRLLVRIAVGGLLIGRPSDLVDSDLTRRLQSVVTKTAASAAVGLIELGAYVSIAVFRLRDRPDHSPSEACLSAYLLAQGVDSFRRDDFAVFGGLADDDGAHAALTAFRQRGLLERRGIATHATWRLSEDARASFIAWRDEHPDPVMPRGA